MSEFADLRKIAEEATPGPWEVATMKASSEFVDYEVHGIKGVATPVWYSDSDMAHTALEDMGLADAEFIATFNPETVVSLLDRVEKAEREVEKRNKRLEHFESEYNRLETVVENMERALQRVRELHKWDQGYCGACDRLYPCPTITALAGGSD